MTRARNIAGFSTITTTPSPVHVGPIGVLTATRIDGEFNLVDLDTRDITAQGIGVTNLQVSGITTGLNVSGIITAQNGINFNGTSTGLNVSGVGTIATLSVTGNATVGGVLTYEDVTRVDSVGVITAREQVHVGTGVSIAAGGLNVTAGISTFQAVQGTTGAFSSNVSVGGELQIADYIVHTGDGDTAIRFPANDILTVELAGTEHLRVDTTATRITDKLAHTGDPDTMIRFPAADTFSVETAGSTRLHIHSDGRFRVGATSQPSGTVSGFQLDMGSYPGTMRLMSGAGASGTQSASFAIGGSNHHADLFNGANSGAQLNLYNYNSTDGNSSAVSFLNSNALSTGRILGVNLSHSSRTGALVFMTSSGSYPTEKMRIDSNGRVVIGNSSASTNYGKVLQIHNSAAAGASVHLTDSTTGTSNSDGFELVMHNQAAYLVQREPSSMIFMTNGTTERLRIDSSGRLLYGVTSSSRETSLILQGNSNSYTTNPGVLELRVGQVPSSSSSLGSLVFGCTGDKIGATISAIADNADWSSGSSHPTAIRFFTTPASSTTQAERLRITRDGRVLAGTSSARANFKNGASGNTATPKFQFETANDDANNSLSLTFGRNNAFGAEIFLAKHRAATVGGTTVVQEGDRLGGLSFNGSDGTNFHPAAYIQAIVDGAPGTDDMPGRLVFATTADGAIVPTTRVEIKNTGRMQVNLPSSSGSSSAITNEQAIVGTKHVHTVYHNFNSTNSGLVISNVIPTNAAGTVDIMGGWANGNGIIFKRFVWCASGDSAISQVFSTAASRYGVSVSISTPTIAISGDYANFTFTFSDSQGSKMEKLKIHFEYHKQFYV